MSQIGPILDGDTDVLNGAPVTALLVQSSNPAVVAPDSGRVRRGLLRDDLFTAVHEQFLTDTARLADIIFLQQPFWNTMTYTSTAILIFNLVEDN